GRHDNFFMLGGHSLLAVRLMNRVSTLGIRLQLSTLFSSPVLSKLAAALSSEMEDQAQTLPDIKPISRDGPLCMSFAQQRLWFLALMDGASATYNIPLTLCIRGRLDLKALQRSLNTVFERHEAWRSTFANIDGQLQVKLLPATLGLPLVEHDLRDEQDIDQQIVALAAAEAKMPFDLEMGPLVRAQLIQVANDEYVLLLTQHHIVSDGWSMGLLMQELSKLYTAFASGTPNPLPSLKIQYPDYAAWQREWLSGTRLREQSDFWKSTLADAPICITLPLDHPRPTRQSYNGAHIPITIDAHTTSALKDISQQLGGTLFMTVLAAWSAVLSRLSGQDDILVGTPSANRDHTDIEQLIGFFVNTLVMRIDLSGDLTVTDLIDRVRHCTIAAQAHQDLPFEQVVEITQPPRSMDHSPLFQVMFAWQNFDTDDLDLPGLNITPMNSNYSVAKFDLNLTLWEGEGEIVGDMTYSTDLFEHSTIERHVGYLQTMLKALLTDVKQSITEVDLLSAKETDLLINTWNKVETSITSPICIHHLFEAQVSRTPDAVAVVHEGHFLTYQELNNKANRMAHHLIALGVKPDVLVALCVERSSAIVVGILAILKAGGAYVPLDPVYASSRLLDIIADAAPLIVVADSHGHETLGSAVLSSMTVVDPNGEFGTSDQNLEVVELNHSHLAYVIYTSGSTGKPKGVMVEHSQVNRLFSATSKWYEFNQSDIWMLTHSYSFDVSVWELWGPLFYGGKLIIPSHHTIQSPEEMHRLICEE
ncbi:hypothetical protein BGZ83_003267, partial [Gryganskiella cystojenkinii]